MKWCWIAVIAIGCGRVGFDDLGDGGPGGGGSGTGSGSGQVTCPAVPNCPDDTLVIQDAGSSNNTNTVMIDHGLSSTMCGSGSANPETTWLVVPDLNGTYVLQTTPAATSMYIQDMCCGGPELKCGAGSLSITRAANQRFVVVVEGAPGTDYTLSLTGD